MKILSFYLTTGHGHISPAQALAATGEKITEDKIETVLIDGLAEASSFHNFLLGNGFWKIIQNYLRSIWHLMYYVAYIPFVRNRILALSKVMRGYVTRMIKEHKPDRIIVYHYLLIKTVESVLKNEGLDIPSFAVVTDAMSSNISWFSSKTSHYIVFSENVARSAGRYGIADDKISVFRGYPLKDEYHTAPDRQKMELLREKLNFLPDRPTVLVLGGGAGMPNVKKIVNGLMKSCAGSNIVVVCGNNQSQQNRIQAIKEKYPHIGGAVLGFSTDIKELIALADVVIAKPGTATVFETLSLKKIMLIPCYLRTEKGMVDFVVDNNYGFHIRSPFKLISMVKRILDRKDPYDILNAHLQDFALIDCRRDVLKLVTGV